MTLAEIADLICSKIGKTDTVSIGLCKSYVRRRYQMIWDSAVWRDSLILATMTAGDDELVMPEQVESVLKVRYDSDRVLSGVDQQLLFDVDPAIFERTGAPWNWSSLTPVATKAMPTSELLRFVSDAADTTTVALQGTLAGARKREIVTLTGTTPVDSTNQYDTVYVLSKEETTGTVSVTGVTSAAALVDLYPEESERKFCRIRLHSQPTDLTKSMLILGKRQFPGLPRDLDTCLLKNIDNTLIAFASADMLERMRQYGKAASKIQEGNALLSEAKKTEADQVGIISQIIPDASAEYSMFDYPTL